MKQETETRKPVIEPKPPYQPERKLVSMLVKPTVWDYVGQMADHYGYSRGEIVEQAIAIMQQQMQQEAA